MQHALPVHRFEAVEDLEQQRADDRLVQAPAGERRHFGEIRAAVVLHDEVGGAVLLEELEHPHDARMADAGERAPLLEKAQLAELELATLARTEGTYGRVVTGAAHQLARKVLLDRDLPAQLLVERAIGLAEAAGTAEAIENTIVSADPATRRQRRRTEGWIDGTRGRRTHVGEVPA